MLKLRALSFVNFTSERQGWIVAEKKDFRRKSLVQMHGNSFHCSMFQCLLYSLSSSLKYYLRFYLSLYILLFPSAHPYVRRSVTTPFAYHSSSEHLLRCVAPLSIALCIFLLFFICYSQVTLKLNEYVLTSLEVKERENLLSFSSLEHLLYYG